MGGAKADAGLRVAEDGFESLGCHGAVEPFQEEVALRAGDPLLDSLREKTEFFLQQTDQGQGLAFSAALVAAFVAALVEALVEAFSAALVETLVEAFSAALLQVFLGELPIPFID